MATETAVERRSDDWIEVPGETQLGATLPLKLHPGADGGKVRFSPTFLDVEVGIAQLRQALVLIEEDHAR